MNKVLIICLLAMTSDMLMADQIKQIISDDGTVTFTNVAATKSAKNQTVIYRYPDAGDVTVFTDQKPTHITTFDILKFDCYACNPDSTIDWNTVALNHSAFAETVNNAAKSNHIDPALVRALIHAESAFNPNARSQKGASGLMQLMPATAKELGVSNIFNAKQNIDGGVRYLARLLKAFNGNISLATAAYNAGPNAVKKYNGIPPYQETKVYVERVSILHKRYKNES
ncbi:MAG: lytic transglycosylase domain-containing protein [Gammaproteobacteria bacterium]|nr:lytic transglycosylase domain-containing protein [Gammaproteobacteria bacterium]